MSDVLKFLMENLHGVLAPLVAKLSDPEARKEFEKSIGYESDPASPPQFPPGSAMERYYTNADKSKDEQLYKEAIEEAGQIIDVLKNFYSTGAAAWHGVENPSSATITQAISELMTLTINIFLLDYFRFRHPHLHNYFLMAGVVDEMGQRTGGSANIWSVIADFLSKGWDGIKMKDQPGVNTTVSALGFVLNIIKFIWFSEVPFFLVTGYESFPRSKYKLADAASNGIFSAGWFFEPTETSNGNVFLTVSPIPASPYGRGFAARLDIPFAIDHRLSEKVSMKIDAATGASFVYSSGLETEADALKQQRLSVTFNYKPSSKSTSLIDSPELTIGYGENHSIELKLSPDEVAIIVKTEGSIKFGRGKATKFPLGYIPDSVFEKTLPATFGWTSRRGFFFDNAGSAGANPSQSPSSTPSTPSTPSSPSTPGGTPGIMARTTSDPSSPGTIAAAGPSLPSPGTSNLFFFNMALNVGFKGLTFQNVHLGIGNIDEKTIVEASLDFKFVLGKVFQLVVTRIGARVLATPRDDMKGYLGRDLDLVFKAPTGIGITVDVSAVRGGGFLSFDDEKGEYIGALELALDISIFKFTLKAFGIIQTKIPGADEKEYSLFIVISSEFAPIPLVFGLTLNGVGGLIGHNRTVDIALIQSEMRSPYLENILFLKDPVGNITRLVSDSTRYFPVAIEKSVFGVSLIIGYGEVFELKMSVIILRPENTILIPGFIRLATPKKSKVLQLNINFLAVINTQEGYLFFRADLVDSKLATFKLAGSLLLAIGWGDSDGLFALSVGGFHPSFKDFPQIKSLPNAFKGLDRIRLSLWEDGKDHLYLEFYIALTSNTRQLGAHACLHVEGPMDFNIDGHLGFDLLWETEPKSYFEAIIEARIDFRRKESVLAGVDLDAVFSGPTPKHIEGKARLKICWFLTVSIPFNKTWGDPALAEVEQTVDVLQLLFNQLQDDRNWRAEIPDFHHLHVTLKPPPVVPDNEIMIQPLGTLVFSQHEVPLGFKIQKMGARKVVEAKTLTIDTIASLTTTYTDLGATEELFAPGQFTDLTEDEKLSKPSFEKMKSGVRIGGTGASTYPKPFIKAKELEYEVGYIRPEFARPKNRDVNIMLSGVFNVLKRGAAVGRSPMSWQSGNGKTSSPKKQVMRANEYVIGTVTDMKLFTSVKPGGFIVSSRFEADQIRQQLVTEKPALRGIIQVMADYEMTT
jgi:hypothetical protein